MREIRSFRTRARVLNQLGEQLIKNESIALLELIKNSYDADASNCHVELSKVDQPKNGTIVITDDGHGMDEDILYNAWLEIGTNYKEERNKNGIYRTPKFNRISIGEKGIGRLGVHRLGNKIEIITRKNNHDEYVLSIDWNLIDKSKYIEDFPVAINKRVPEEFINCTGTKIIIKSLKTPWNRKLVRDTYRSIASLNSPFESIGSFNVELDIDNNWLDGLYTHETVKEHSLFAFDIIINGDEILKFDYKFTPWPTMQKLQVRSLSITDKEISSLTRMQYKDNETRDYIDIDIGKYRIGQVRFTGLIFDRDTRVLNLGIEDKRGFKKYLDQNGGVRVFRDNMRVMDYGEPGDDWLDLEGRRINIPAKRISKNIILAGVFLERSASIDLIEKANREGFVENEAYYELWHTIRFCIDRIESLRKTDKDLLRLYYGPDQTFEPVITTLSELKASIESNVKDQQAKNQMFVYLDRINSEYEQVTSNLIKSAGAGLNLIIVIHQVEKIIKDITEMLKSKAETDIISDRVHSLSELIQGYSILVRNSDIKSRDLNKILKQGVFNINFRLMAHGIRIETPYLTHGKTFNGLCSESHILNAVMNIFDNSIFWLGYSKTTDPCIYVDISEELKDYVSIVILDNGPGFAKPYEEIVKPFVSDKIGGMGIGLALTNEIMNSLKGKLIFDVKEYFDIPDKYKNGAHVALALKKG